MEFEEMKKIWDTQNNEQIYGIDEQALHRRVTRKNIGIKRMANITEWGMLIISFMLALFMIIKGILDNEIYKFPQGAIFLIVVGYIYWDRKKRLKNEGQSDRTLLGDLEQALRTIDYQIRRQRNFLWWFLMPTAATILINMAYTYDGKPWWVWLFVMASFALSYWLVKKGLQCKILPKKENLESLRNLLIEAES